MPNLPSSPALIEFSRLLNLSPNWSETILGFSSLLHLTSLTQNGSHWVQLRRRAWWAHAEASILGPCCGLESDGASCRLPDSLKPPLGKGRILGHRSPYENGMVGS